MKKYFGFNKIIFLEISGFLTIAILHWFFDYFDLPCRCLGLESHPVNYYGGILETAVIVIIATIIAIHTRRCLDRIKQLEGFIRVCCNCKKVHYENKWIYWDEYISIHSKVKCTHGLCEDCLTELYGDLGASKKGTNS